MMYKRMGRNLLGAAMMIIIIVGCMQLFDLPLAAWVAEYLRSNALYAKTSNMPDLLLIAVVTLTCLSWIGYFWLILRNIHNKNTFFCRLTGIVLPLSFILKMFLKWLFGRMETRTWLLDPSLYGFHWFAGADGFQGFPSGHMLVFSPLFLAMWNFYPRYRVVYGVAWLGLGVALIATDYHFLSDVLAGAIIGVIVYLAVIRSIGGVKQRPTVSGAVAITKPT
jgi:membrane-associated phospholipid phosphatase